MSAATANTASDDAYCAREARRHDPDRAFAAFFAPDDKRPALLALIAFNVEIARTRETVSEAMLGEIRLQWWRETVEEMYAGQPRRHAVVQPLAEAVARYRLSRAHFDRLIDARAFDLGDEPPASMIELTAYAEATSASLTALALEVLGVEDEAAAAAARHVGIAWALTGLLRAVPFHAGAGRQYLPAELMAEEGATSADLFALRPTPALAGVVRRVAEVAREHLAAARRAPRRPVSQAVPRQALPALLPAVLADAYLGRMARADYDVISRPVEIGRAARILRLAWAHRRRRY